MGEDLHFFGAAVAVDKVLRDFLRKVSRNRDPGQKQVGQVWLSTLQR